MISLFLWFGVLSSGGVLCASVWKKRYEETIPITCSAIVVVLFLCGIAGNLMIGAVLVEILAVMTYIIAFAWLLKTKYMKEFIIKFFTPGFFIFLIMFIFACSFNNGKMASSGDEFSHWVDIVKVMVIWDDYGTNPNAHSVFPSYPPGMSLFQYFLQRLFIWTSENDFSEWLIYVAYQVIVFAFMMPFLKNLNKKKVFSALASMIIIFLCPLLFYNRIYTEVYIDPALGILYGTGLATVFMCKEKDIFYTLRIMSTCMMLVLFKDAGMLLAVFIALTYILVYILENKINMNNIKSIKWWMWIISPLLATSIPRLLWSYHLKVTEASKKSFSVPIDMKKLIKIISGKKVGYQSEVWKGYYEKLATEPLSIGNTGISLNYLGLAFFLLGILLIVYLFCEKDQELRIPKSKLLTGVIITQFIIYIVGLCITYIFRFTEYEATRFSSFTRYVNIVYLAMWVFCVMLLLEVMHKTQKEWAILLILGSMLLISPMEYVCNYINGYYVTTSVGLRKQYVLISSEIEKYIPDESKIFFIAQETRGLDLLIVAYNVRAKSYEFSHDYSIGEPFYEGDAWTESMDADMWRQQLMEDYDYVALHKINDYFVENFSDVFEDASEIANGTVFRVNKQTGLLERCE